jgi:hypothetical protein
MTTEWIDDYTDKAKDLEDLEKLKRTGLPLGGDLSNEELGYHWSYIANPDSAWIDMHGRTIKNPEEYQISTVPGTIGMPMTKEEIEMATKKPVVKKKAPDVETPDDQKGGFIPFKKGVKPVKKKK